MASLAEKRVSDPEDPPADPQARPEELRLLEALLFASTEPLDQATLAKRMPEGVDIKVALAQLQADYASRGVNLVRVANKWTFRTRGDRDAGDHRLSSACYPRGDRGNPRRDHLQGDAGRVARNRLDPAARPPQD